MKFEIVGGQHDGEVYDLPDDFKVPKPTESLAENTINQAYTQVELAKFEKVMAILKEGGPGVELREVREKPPWQR